MSSQSNARWWNWVLAPLSQCSAAPSAAWNRPRTGLDGQDAPAARLGAGCRAYADFGWAHPARYRLMFAASGYAADAVDAFTLIEHAIDDCVSAGVSASIDTHADTYLLWVAMHGLATLDKPARSDYLRLGPIDRPAALTALVHRLARIT